MERSSILVQQVRNTFLSSFCSQEKKILEFFSLKIYYDLQHIK